MVKYGQRCPGFSLMLPFFKRPLFALAMVWALLLPVTGCQEKPAVAAQAPPALAAELQPIYARSCATCHANPASGAPLAGDRGAWAPRMGKGREMLLEHTINGFNGMPPMGACADCSEEQYAALIGYMSGTRLEQ